MDKSNLLENMIKFDNKFNPKTKESKAKKFVFDSVNAFYEGRVITFNAFINEIFPIKATQGKGRPRMLASHPSELVCDSKY